MTTRAILDGLHRLPASSIPQKTGKATCLSVTLLQHKNRYPRKDSGKPALAKPLIIRRLAGPAYFLGFRSWPRALYYITFSIFSHTYLCHKKAVNHINIAIYARVSTDQQAEQGYSLGAQVADCTAKARELGGTMIKEYVDDGYSGAYLERPALSELREALRAKMFQAVVVYDVDRLSRNLAHQLLVTEEIEKSGATLHFVKANYEASPEGRLFYAMRGAFAGYEREKTRERSMRGKLAKLRQGKAIQDSHVYGYDFDKGNNCYKVNPGEAANIKKIYELYLTGNYSVRKLVLWLNERKDEYPPANGKAWSTTPIHDILSREMYTGTWYAHRITHEKTGIKSSRKVIRPQSEWIEMSCPAIITKEEHEKALYQLKRNRRLAHFQRHEPYMLQGIAYCGVCGRALSCRVGYAPKGREPVRWYTCWVNDSLGTSYPSKCGNRQMKCTVIDEAVWELLKEICKSKSKLKSYIERTKPKESERKSKKSEDKTKKLEKIKAERKAVMSWFSQQLLSHSEATEKLEALKRAEEALLRESIAEPAPARQMDYSAVCEAVSTCEENSKVRRELFHRIVDRVILTRTDKGKGPKNYNIDIQIVFR